MTKQLHIHLDEHDHQLFVRLAKAEDLSISQLSRRIVREYIKKNSRSLPSQNTPTGDSTDTIT